MTDLPGSSGEDRVVGIEAVDGFAFESDGSPITELDVDAPDSLVDKGATVAEQAMSGRSWRFGHVIVDEAQDLTPMQWRMIARRARGGSMTIVGDLAQRSIGEPGEWGQHLPDSLRDFAYQELTINYRSPTEVNDLAAAVMAELAPGLAQSSAIRSVGHHPVFAHLADLSSDLGPTVAAHRRQRPEGRMAVIGLDLPSQPDQPLPGVEWLSPWQAKGLEFDSVVLVEPARLLDEHFGLSLLYVAITRTTDDLLILHQRPLPPVLT